jgi:hypothetical protein
VGVTLSSGGTQAHGVPLVFKAPGEERDGIDDLSSSVPLLQGGIERIRRPEDDELEELVEIEGPKTGVRGTMMDGIANVSPQIIA